MSFSLTKAAFLDGTKTVTRRLGWKGLKPGTRIMAVEKAMGLRKGEKMVDLGEIEVVSAGASRCRRSARPTWWRRDSPTWIRTSL